MLFSDQETITDKNDTYLPSSVSSIAVSLDLQDYD